MKRTLAILFLCAAAAFPQVASHANTRYKTKEGREAISRTLAAHDRDARQKPLELIEALELKPGMTVADIGTGVGYMLPFLTRAVGPTGKVYAEDIFPDFLDKARERAKEKQLDGVVFVQGDEKDVRLPADSIDLALILDAYHHFDWPEEMMASVRRSLRRDGRLVIVDFYKEGFGDPNHIRLDEPDVVKEIESYGFKAVVRKPFVEKRQYLAVFEKK
jgi:ubiquinone/menaquinone biosynthesis C-methylase UbiE